MGRFAFEVQCRNSPKYSLMRVVSPDYELASGHTFGSIQNVVAF
jgi:acetyl esterase/lipase